MQEHEQSRDKLQQSTLQAWRQLFWCASTFMNIHDSICFTNSPCWSLHLQCVPHAGGTYEAMGQSYGQIPLDVRGHFLTTEPSMLLGFCIRNKSIHKIPVEVGSRIFWNWCENHKLYTVVNSKKKQLAMAMISCVLLLFLKRHDRQRCFR